MKNKILFLGLTAVILTYSLPAQAQIITGRDYSYFGFNGNIGISDENENTAIENLAVIINSKIAVTPYLSLRPSIIFADKQSYLIPATLDFSFSRNQPVVPYIGGGVVFGVKDGVLLTTGIDMRLGDEFVVNAGVNTGLINGRTDTGLYLGLGFIFPKD